MVKYIISITEQNLVEHTVDIQCVVTNPQIDLLISLPTWIPGSYCIRNFAKFITSIGCLADGSEVALIAQNDCSWQILGKYKEVIINYKVYAFDRQPRGSFVDQDKVFLQGARCFLQIAGKVDDEHTVGLRFSDKLLKEWQCETTLVANAASCDIVYSYVAKNYYELIDNPILLGCLSKFNFELSACLHELVITGTSVSEEAVDWQRLILDIEKICSVQIKLWGSLPDISRYIFFLHISEQGYGGIEHSNCTSLLIDRDSLPYFNKAYDNRAKYQDFLGLISHEYFHLWNVKRIKPYNFYHPKLDAPVYTTQLWIFEGLTSYYDDLCLLFAGVISQDDYVAKLTKLCNYVLTTPGVLQHSLADASWQAWIKFYHAHENSANSETCYYRKGAMVGLLLDLIILHKTHGKKRLLDVLRILWGDYLNAGVLLGDGDFERTVSKVVGEDLYDFFQAAVYSCGELSVESWLATVGVSLQALSADELYRWGIAVVDGCGDFPKVRLVYANSVMQVAGVSPEDLLIAVNQQGLAGAKLDALLQCCLPDKQVCLTILRDGWLKNIKVGYPRAEVFKYKCFIDASLSEGHRDLWLKAPI